MRNDHVLYIVFSDLHANYYALESLCSYVNSISAERRVNIVFLGDLVGYYSVDPRMLALFEEMIEHYNLKLLLGNHDAKFLNTYFGADYQVNCEIPFMGSIMSDSALRAGIHRLLIKAELTAEISVLGRRIVFSHGGISDPLNAYYYPDLKFLLNAEMEFQDNTDYICGHTHHPYIHEEETIRHINVGSLGMPRDSHVKGSFLVIDGTVRSIRRISYDLDRQFEANIDMPNEVRNRVYFGGNSRFIRDNLLDIDDVDVTVLGRNMDGATRYRRLLLLQDGTKVLKSESSYLCVTNKGESRYATLELLKEDLDNGVQHTNHGD